MKAAEPKVLPVTVPQPAEYNPRKKLKPGANEYEKIKNSIEEFSCTEAPCAVVDIDKTRKKALNIARNKSSDACAGRFAQGYSGFQFWPRTGFDSPEIGPLFNNSHTKDVAEDDFDVEAELAKPIFFTLGNLWCLGKHRVICGDSTGEEIYN